MLRQLATAVCMLVVLTLVTGVIYPMAMTGMAQVLFPYQAQGSLVIKNGELVGSKLIGQQFKEPGYFHGRPSAAGQDGYDATSSGGSNLGPTNKKLIDTVQDNVKAVREENGLIIDSVVPADLVTASASGLDPDISVEGAYIQINRIAQARGMSVDVVRQLVKSTHQSRLWGLFGDPRVNVLALNLALDGVQ
jgi:K+-transporting ATPase ATPase C chain